MNFKKSVEMFFDKVGSKVAVNIDSVKYDITAVIEPMRYKNKMYIGLNPNELGLIDNECYLYLGPAKPDFAGREQGVIVTFGDRSYNVLRADRISYANETVYIWAVLTPRILEGQYEVV